MAFKCPQCGGTHWGTSQAAPYSVVRGYCHDEFDRLCNFTWPRSEVEDTKVGIEPVENRTPKSDATRLSLNTFEGRFGL